MSTGRVTSSPLMIWVMVGHLSRQGMNGKNHQQKGGEKWGNWGFTNELPTKIEDLTVI
jgi:hypothetical protein